MSDFHITAIFLSTAKKIASVSCSLSKSNLQVANLWIRWRNANRFVFIYWCCCLYRKSMYTISTQVVIEEGAETWGGVSLEIVGVTAGNACHC